jgi:hypothetical protein
VEEVGMVPVPVLVPICIVTFGDVAHSAIQRRVPGCWGLTRR